MRFIVSLLFLSFSVMAAEWQQDWYQYVYDQIADDSRLLSYEGEDVQNLCPNWMEMDLNHRREFWGYFFRGIAKGESNFRPVTRYQENIPDREGNPSLDAVTREIITSEGLLQLSYQNIRYHDCEFQWSGVDEHLAERDPNKTIFDPRLNLQCGVRILQNQLRSRGELFPRRAYYWSVLRTTSNRHQVVLDEINEHSRELCYGEISSGNSHIVSERGETPPSQISEDTEQVQERVNTLFATVRDLLWGSNTSDEISAQPHWDENYIETILDFLSESSSLYEYEGDDVIRLCENYRSLDLNERKLFWAITLQEMAGLASHYNETMRLVWSGTDAVTGQSHASEGLMGVSYQDARYYGCQFDWAADMNLAVDSPQKSIYNPRHNLECGFKVLERQVERREALFLDRRGYWPMMTLSNGQNPTLQNRIRTSAQTLCQE